MTAPLRFGVLLGSGGPGPVAVARRAEALGFESFFVPDHFNEIVSPIPTLTAVATATGLDVGTYMLANDLRHPAVTARDLATLDVLSDGRAILGIGAGWMTIDYDAIGRSIEPFSIRLARLREAIELIRCQWRGESFAGEFYSSRPGTTVRPVQPSGPPVMVGGGGPKMLAAAAQMADIVSIGVPLKSGDRAGLIERVASATFDDLAQRVALVRNAAATRLDMLLFRVSKDPSEVGVAYGADEDQVGQSPYLQAGSLDQIADGFARLGEIGIESIVVRADDMEVAAQARQRMAVATT